MIFKRAFWFAASLGATVLNIAAGIYALVRTEPMHAFMHGAAAFGFGLLAIYLRPRGAAAQSRVPAADRTQQLEASLSELEDELRETRARLEFTDQLLKNKPPPS